MSKKGNFYCDPIRFGELLVLAQNEGRVSDELAKMAADIGQGVHAKYKFFGIDKSEARSIAVMEVCTKYMKYKHDESKGKSRGFNFFTTCILNAFRGHFRQLKQYYELKQRATELHKQKQNYEIRHGG